MIVLYLLVAIVGLCGFLALVISHLTYPEHVSNTIALSMVWLSLIGAIMGAAGKAQSWLEDNDLNSRWRSLNETLAKFASRRNAGQEGANSRSSSDNGEDCQ